MIKDDSLIDYDFNNLDFFNGQPSTFHSIIKHPSSQFSPAPLEQNIHSPWFQPYGNGTAHSTNLIE